MCPPRLPAVFSSSGRMRKVLSGMFPGRFVALGQVLRAIAAAPLPAGAPAAGAAPRPPRPPPGGTARSPAPAPPPAAAVNRREDIDCPRPSSDRNRESSGQSPNCISRRTIPVKVGEPSPDNLNGLVMVVARVASAD